MVQIGDHVKVINEWGYANATVSGTIIDKREDAGKIVFQVSLPERTLWIQADRLSKI